MTCSTCNPRLSFKSVLRAPDNHAVEKRPMEECKHSEFENPGSGDGFSVGLGFMLYINPSRALRRRGTVQSCRKTSATRASRCPWHWLNTATSSESQSQCEHKELMAALVSIVLLVALAILIGMVQAQPHSRVYTTYHDYDPARSNYDLSTLYCGTYVHKPLEWRMRYRWTAFAKTLGMNPGLCGKCIEVTNTDTGARTMVRILDQCANGGLDLEQAAFEEIDTNGAGYNAGHLWISFTFRDC